MLFLDTGSLFQCFKFSPPDVSHFDQNCHRPITVRCRSVLARNYIGKNGVSRYFEIWTTQRSTYDPLKLLEKRTRFREAIWNVSDIVAFRRKILSEKELSFEVFWNFIYVAAYIWPSRISWLLYLNFLS